MSLTLQKTAGGDLLKLNTGELMGACCCGGSFDWTDIIEIINALQEREDVSTIQQLGHGGASNTWGLAGVQTYTISTPNPLPPGAFTGTYSVPDTNKMIATVLSQITAKLKRFYTPANYGTIDDSIASGGDISGLATVPYLTLTEFNTALANFKSGTVFWFDKALSVGGFNWTAGTILTAWGTNGHGDVVLGTSNWTALITENVAVLLILVTAVKHFYSDDTHYPIFTGHQPLNKSGDYTSAVSLADAEGQAITAWLANPGFLYGSNYYSNSKWQDYGAGVGPWYAKVETYEGHYDWDVSAYHVDARTFLILSNAPERYDATSFPIHPAEGKYGHWSAADISTDTGTTPTLCNTTSPFLPYVYPGNNAVYNGANVVKIAAVLDPVFVYAP